jgi:hypothetical protein
MEEQTEATQNIGTDSSTDYEERENLWDQQWPGDSEAEQVHTVTDIDNLDEELPFPDVVGTRDALESVRDAEAYMPPTDPPVLPGGREAIHTATGFGTSPDEEVSRDAPFASDADLEEEALVLLREDSLTSRYDLIPTVDSGVVTIRGVVSDLDDAEHALSIVGEIQGVVDVVDDMTLDPDVRA